MQAWMTALGGRQEADDRVVFDTPDQARLALDETVVTPLMHLGALDVVGAGADKLLQGQSSAQMAHADGRFAPLAVFCTPKGRMLANAQIMRIEEGRYRLLMHRGLIAPLAEQLGKFAAFYKTELTPRDDLALIGLIGREAPALAEAALSLAPPALWHQTGDAETQLLTHPGPRPRQLICLAAEQAATLWQSLTEQAAPVGNAVWCLHDIQAGLAWLTPTHRDALLPQMINWEALGGISFKKGCYTGQEVVARAHFRGQVKRRLVRARVEGGDLPLLASPVATAEGKSVGEVVAAEFDADGGIELLAVLSTKEDLGPLGVAGQTFERLELPYSVERLDPEGLVAHG